MTPPTLEWVTKAEADWSTAQRKMRVRRATNFDAVCFHAQQCAEKYLKACLQELDEPFPKTHHLGQLLDLLLPSEPEWQKLRPSLLTLTMSAVSVRYPGTGANRTVAREALETCSEVRSRARQRLGARHARNRKPRKGD